MKLLLSIITTISLFYLPAFGSTLVSIENGGKNIFVTVTIWKHTDGQNDDVNHLYFTEKDLQPVAGLLKDKHKIRIIFNDGVFTAMDYWDKATRKWAQLSQGEKDAIFFIQEKFDVTDK